MGLRVLGTAAVPSAAIRFATQMSGWSVFGDASPQSGSVTQAMPTYSMYRSTRPNNDGPGWTENRTTSLPDKGRPIPFKQIVASGGLRTFDPIPFIPRGRNL